MANTLHRAGHSCDLHDIDAWSADRFLQRESGQKLLERGRALSNAMIASGQTLAGVKLERALFFAEPNLHDAEDAKRKLLDVSSGLSLAEQVEAYRIIKKALSAFYSEPRMCEITSPQFLEELDARVAEQTWSPIHEFYGEVAIDQILATSPDLVHIVLTHVSQCVEGLRLSRDLKKRAPHLRQSLGGLVIERHPETWLSAGSCLASFDGLVLASQSEFLIDVLECFSGHRSFGEVRGLVYRDADGVTRGPKLAIRSCDEEVLEAVDGLDWSPSHPTGFPKVMSLEKPLADDGETWDHFERILEAVAVLKGPLPLVIGGEPWSPSQLRRLRDFLNATKGEIEWSLRVEPNKGLTDAFVSSLTSVGLRAVTLVRDSVTASVATHECTQELIESNIETLKSAGLAVDVSWGIGHKEESKSDVLSVAEWAAKLSDMGVGASYVGIVRSVDESQRTVSDKELHLLDCALGPFEVATLFARGLAPFREVKTVPDRAHFFVPMEVAHFCGRPLLESSKALLNLSDPLRTAFYDDDFGFRRDLAKSWRDILDEWKQLKDSDLIEWPEEGSYVTGTWRLFPLCLAGCEIGENLERVPRLKALLEDVPGLYAATFSILEPGTLIPEHTGLNDFVFRYHLGLVIPGQGVFRVGQSYREWQCGEGIAFDDTIPHNAWNFSSERRVLLMIDFIPPGARGVSSSIQREKIALDRNHYSKLFPRYAADFDDRDEVNVGTSGVS